MAQRSLRHNVISFIGTAFGGVRGRQNVAAWLVAGTAAYFMWSKQEREAREEEARALLLRQKDLHRYVERTRPVPDPQERGLVRGKQNNSVNDS